MRDVFINALEIVIHIVMGQLILVVVIAAMVSMGNMGRPGNGIPGGGFTLGLMILIGGGLSTILIGGFL